MRCIGADDREHRNLRHRKLYDFQAFLCIFIDYSLDRRGLASTLIAVQKNIIGCTACQKCARIGENLCLLMRITPVSYTHLLMRSSI